MRSNSILLLLLLWLSSACQSTKNVPGKNEFTSLFNGASLAGWVNVNEAPDTWMIEQEQIVCSGKTQSNLRTQQAYENYVLEFDCLREQDNGEAAIILHSEELPSMGAALPEGIRCDITNGGWDHYSIQNNKSKIQLSINGKVTRNIKTGGLHNGYITFSSNGAKFRLRNIRIRQLSEQAPAIAGNRFYPLYNHHDLAHWNMLPGHVSHWTAKGNVINYDGNSKEKDKCLWSRKTFRDFILVADVRLTRAPEMARTPVILPNGDNALNADGTNKEVDMLYNGDSGIYLRGESKSQVNFGNRYIGSGEIYGYRTDKKLPPEVRAGATPKIKADNAPGQWNRFVITMKGDRVTVVLNNKTVINNALLPGIPAEGPIALQDDHADNNQLQFANIYISEIN